MIVSILIFILVLSILVLVHELGHFLVARRAGVMVEEFGFGLPPRIVGKKIGDTIYSLNWLPFGGFVRLHGEQEEEGASDPNSGRAFMNKSKKIRSMVVTAGVVMNFILGILAFAIVYSFSGIPRDTGKIKVVDVSAGSPAQVAGIVVGDVITKVGPVSVTSADDFIAKTAALKGKSTIFEVQRMVGGQVTAVKLMLTPRENPPPGEGPIGVTITTMELYYPPIWLRPFYGIYYGFKDAIFWGQTIVLGLWGIITSLVKGQVPQGVSGPVGIFAVTTEAAKSGILTLVNFVGILSVNLAILNIVPFPALDGGRLLFIGIEGIIGRKIVPKVEATINNIGFLILLALLLLITIGDVRHLISAGSINGFINSIGK
ncbi:MAG: M50 family metallopeptidase [Candidatus Microgenomates bacterium]